jgi:hypothetical protein
MNIAYLILKFSLSAALLVTVSEIAKRSSLWAAFLASLPLTSLLAFIWLYLDTQDTTKVADLSMAIFWLVIPSLALFPSLALMLKAGLSFGWALGGSITLTLAAYALTLWLLPAAR